VVIVAARLYFATARTRVQRPLGEWLSANHIAVDALTAAIIFFSVAMLLGAPAPSPCAPAGPATPPRHRRRPALRAGQVTRPGREAPARDQGSSGRRFVMSR